jgi:hypothetical protein
MGEYKDIVTVIAGLAFAALLYWMFFIVPKKHGPTQTGGFVVKFSPEGPAVIHSGALGGAVVTLGADGAPHGAAYTIAWGDGKECGGVLGSGGFPTHSYGKVGDYAVQVTLDGKLYQGTVQVRSAFPLKIVSLWFSRWPTPSDGEITSIDTRYLAHGCSQHSGDPQAVSGIFTGGVPVEVKLEVTRDRDGARFLVMDQYKSVVSSGNVTPKWSKDRIFYVEFGNTTEKLVAPGTWNPIPIGVDPRDEYKVAAAAGMVIDIQDTSLCGGTCASGVKMAVTPKGCGPVPPYVPPVTDGMLEAFTAKLDARNDYGQEAQAIIRGKYLRETHCGK